MTPTRHPRTPQAWLRRSAVTAVTALALTVLAPAPTVTAAAAGTDCGTTPGSRQVVLLVHGYNSEPDTWSTATRTYLASTTSCVSVFDYARVSTNWVTDPAIGPALAVKILALAAASTAGGGTGQVVIVAHSMGGLAVRCAVAPACSGHPGVADAIAGLVTFDSPNQGTWTKGYGASVIADILGPLLSAGCTTGSPLLILIGCDQVKALGTSAGAKAFTPGSGQLAALPALGGDFPVLALAGSVRVETSFWGRSGKVIGEAGDLVVGTGSALAVSRRVDGIGGTATIDCGYLDVSSPQPGSLECWHTRETNNDQFLSRALAFITAVRRQAANSLTWSGYRGAAPGQSLTDAARTLGGEVTRECTFELITYPGDQDVSVDDAGVGDHLAHEITVHTPAVTGPGGIRIGMFLAAARNAFGPTVRSRVDTGTGLLVLYRAGPGGRGLWATADTNSKIVVFGLADTVGQALDDSTIEGC